DIEKEEQWLNEQLQKGYRCTNISGLGIYTFEKADKRYVMRLDYQDYLSKKKFKDYKDIYEDFGWFYINGPWLSGIRYWQKEDDNQNEIFSDRQSIGNYYKRIMNYSFMLGMLCLFFSYLLYKDYELYLTEDFWSMKDALFWKAFLFEIPFVLFSLLTAFLVIFFVTRLVSFSRNYLF